MRVPDNRVQDRPLAGLMVLDLTLARAGPTCVRHLADWGADVIAIQPPEAPEDPSGARDGFDYQNLHRNKRFVSLDLKSAKGRTAFLKLVERTDVLVENMRAPVKHRLNIALSAGLSGILIPPWGHWRGSSAGLAVCSRGVAPGVTKRCPAFRL